MMKSLREARADRLLSIRELARQASVAPSTIYLIEAGRATPRPRVVRQLSRVLGIDPSEVEEFRRMIERSKSPAQRHPGSRARETGRGQPTQPPGDGCGRGQMLSGC
jgi:ribosome-binding protein aMBF1 (putative translation factor)